MEMFFMESNILIPFALVGMKIKHIEDITKTDECCCLECGGKLILREGEKNTKHLAHKNDTKCFYENEIKYKKSGVESYAHKFVKEYLKDNLEYFREFSIEIVSKDNEFKLGGEKNSKIKKIHIEYRNLKKELILEKDYFPDLLIEVENKYIALEIYKTNKKDEKSLKDNLLGKNIDVYEIDINNINEFKVENLIKGECIKLIFSNLKVGYDECINAMQNELLEYRNRFHLAEQWYLDMKRLYNEANSDNRWTRQRNEELVEEKRILEEKILNVTENSNAEINLLKQNIENNNINNFKYREKYISDIKSNFNKDIRCKMQITSKGVLIDICKKFNEIAKEFVLNGSDEKLGQLKKFYEDYTENIYLLDNNEKELCRKLGME